MQDLEKLEALYKEAKDAYYTGNEIMSDDEFDELEEELKLAGSEVVGQVGEISDRNSKHKHWSKVLSLSKIQSDLLGNPPTQDFIKWSSARGATLGGKRFFKNQATPKYDGNSVNLQYSDGRLKIAITRGNGEQGRDVTQTVSLLVPNVISFDSDCEVRGEVMIPTAIFIAKYKNNIARFGKEFKNPRNFVAGMLNREDLELDIAMDLVFVAYDFRVYAGGNRYMDDEITFLQDVLHFNPVYKVPTFHMINFQAEEFEAMYRFFYELRQTIEFQLDGIVIKCSSADDKQKLGTNSHDPEFAIAVKFPPKKTLTTILDIEWNIGNTGELIPVAILEPVDLDGSTVGRASLASWGNLRNKNCFPGAQVTIAKAGDIIPHIYDVVKAGDANYAYPTICPCCQAPLQIDDKHIVCINDECDAKLKKRFFECMAILGFMSFGPAVMNDFWNAGFNSPVDFFNPALMNKQFLIQTGHFQAGRSLDKLFEQLKKVKEIEMYKLVVCFKYTGIGNTSSKQLVKKLCGQTYSYDGLERKPLEIWEQEDSMPRINFDLLREGISYFGIKIIEPKELTGVGMEMTGSPKSAGFSTKEEFLKVAAPFGYFHSDLKTAKFLITDSYTSSSSKMKKAEKVGAEIITYADFVTKYCGVAKTEEETKTTSLF